VDSVRPGDSLQLRSKTKLIVTDNSKIGTVVDGEKLSKDSTTLTKDKHVLKLGNFPDLFR
jgi:hypothetical protein